MLDIVTPTIYHYDYALQAIEKAFIFYRKPVTQTLEQAEELLKQCREKGIKAQVGHVERYNPAFIATKEYIKTRCSLKSTDLRNLIRAERMFR